MYCWRDIIQEPFHGLPRGSKLRLMSNLRIPSVSRHMAVRFAAKFAFSRKTFGTETGPTQNHLPSSPDTSFGGVTSCSSQSPRTRVCLATKEVSRYVSVTSEQFRLFTLLATSLQSRSRMTNMGFWIHQVSPALAQSHKFPKS